MVPKRLGSNPPDASRGRPQVQRSGQVNVTDPGGFELFYSVSDRAGNKARIARRDVVVVRPALLVRARAPPCKTAVASGGEWWRARATATGGAPLRVRSPRCRQYQI